MWLRKKATELQNKEQILAEKKQKEYQRLMNFQKLNADIFYGDKIADLHGLPSKLNYSIETRLYGNVIEISAGLCKICKITFEVVEANQPATAPYYCNNTVTFFRNVPDQQIFAKDNCQLEENTLAQYLLEFINI